MTFRLPRLPTNWREQPQLFERYWDETLSSIEKTLNAILDIPTIQAAVAAAQAAATDAQAAADTAQSAADTAQSNVDGEALENSLVNSYISTSGTIVSAGSSGVVTIASHTRVYGNATLNPNVAVSGGTLATGAAPLDVIRVYYDDPSRAGGSVSYQYTIDPATAPVQKGNRHVVGAVVIPSSGTQTGKPLKGPGYIDPDLL